MKVLLADDDPVSRRMVEASLGKWGYEVQLCRDGGEAWRVLQGSEAPRLAILDWMMPGLDGLEICKLVRSRKDAPYTYIILLTAKTAKDDVIEGLEVGADDYITKPFNANELRVRLRSGRRILELQESLLSLQERLKHQAMHDPLTGEWNHSSILEILNKELSRARRDGSKVGLMMCDLDEFKKVNDTYGHPAGDAVLQETIRRIRLALRDYDELGRYGGDEFLMVLSRCDEDTAASISKRIRDAIESSPIKIPEGIVPVTVSLGVAIGGGGSKWDASQLVKLADIALYRAKRKGRNCYEVIGLESGAEYEPMSSINLEVDVA